MTLTINGQLFSFVFRYTEDVPNPKLAGETCKQTTCIIREGTGKEAKEVARANSYCNIRDHFCKSCGRIKAFTRAVKELQLDRAGRTSFWSAYGEMVNHKWR